MNKKYKVNLHLIESCNYKCNHCFAKFGAKKLLDSKEWINIIDNCEKSINVSSYNIVGGEPLLYTNLDKILSYISKPISLITNSSLVNDKFIKKMLRSFIWLVFQ